MKILLMPSAYHPSLGGVEELTSKLARCYTQCNHTSIIVTNRWPKSLPSKQVISGCDVFRVCFRLPERNLRTLVLFLMLSWISILQLVIIVSKFRPDIIHVICCSSNLPYAMFVSKLFKIPLVVTAQGEIGMDAAGLFKTDMFVPRHFRRHIQSASWITACSIDTQQELLDYSGTTNCDVVHNGIDITEFKPKHPNPRKASGRPFVFALGRHVFQKGFDVLIRAWGLLNNPHFDLVVGGAGSDTEKLSELIADLGLNESVHLVGRLDRGGVVSHLQHACCFILPSRHEPFGIVVLEAMAARTPVIATAVGGVPEFVIDDVNGRLIPSDNVDAMAKALQEVIVNGPVETQLDAGYETAVRHDWYSIATKYLNIYSKCIAGELQV